jgi:hypothetical protein
MNYTEICNQYCPRAQKSLTREPSPVHRRCRFRPRPTETGSQLTREKTSRTQARRQPSLSQDACSAATAGKQLPAAYGRVRRPYISMPLQPPSSLACATSPINRCPAGGWFAMATPIRPAAAAPPAPARPPQPMPPPPPPHHDTTLTLSLALPPPPPPSPFARARGVAPRPAPRPPDVVVARPAAVRSSPPAGGTPPCSECGKRFSSWKALFGHMRCHPERQWRGMTPPPHFWHQFTVQERETATSLLMLRGDRPAGAAGSRGRKSILGAAGTSASSSLPRCDDHKCSVCVRGFATGRALGGHKRCHWEKTEGAPPAVATCSGDGFSASSSQAAPAATLDLNLPPLPRKSDQDGSLDATLDLKLGF